MTTQTASKTHWPDYSEYGLYLLPRSNQTEYGFSEDDDPGRCLLLLDTKQVITEKTAHQANLHLILHSEDYGASLYVILPYERRKGRFNYYGASELLQKLELGYVARSQSILPSQAAENFKTALGAIHSEVKDLLDFSTSIGVNHEGDTVFLSPYGRYLERITTNEDGSQKIERLRASDVPLALCLYAVNEEGEVDQSALYDCVRAFLNTAEHHAFDEKTAKAFAHMVFQKRPKEIMFPSSVDVSASMIDSLVAQLQPLGLGNWQLFCNTVLLNENVELHSQVFNSESYQEFIYQLKAKQSNRHNLSSEAGFRNMFKPSVPTCISAILGKILIPDGLDVEENSVAYCPSVGNGSLLAGIKEPLAFHANESDINNFMLLKSFVEKSGEINKDRPKKPHFTVTNKELALITPTTDYAYNISLLPAGPSPISTLIPFFDEHGGRHQSLFTDLLDQTFIIETLERRSAKGRSVFLGPLDKDQMPGVVTKKSVRILQYLQAYFHDVSVVDLDKSLFLQNGTAVPTRLYIIGDEKPKPSNISVLNDRSGHISEGFKIPVFRRFEQLIDFEQAIRLINISKRRPDIDPTSMVADLEDSEALTSEERDLMSLFYTLKPKSSHDEARITEEAYDEPEGVSKDRSSGEMVFVSHTGELITPKNLKKKPSEIDLSDDTTSSEDESVDLEAKNEQGSETDVNGNSDGLEVGADDNEGETASPTDNKEGGAGEQESETTVDDENAEAIDTPDDNLSAESEDGDNGESPNQATPTKKDLDDSEDNHTVEAEVDDGDGDASESGSDEDEASSDTGNPDEGGTPAETEDSEEDSNTEDYLGDELYLGAASLLGGGGDDLDDVLFDDDKDFDEPGETLEEDEDPGIKFQTKPGVANIAMSEELNKLLEEGRVLAAQKKLESTKPASLESVLGGLSGATDEQSEPLTKEGLEEGLKDSFSGPRYIDNPKKYLLNRKALNHNNKKSVPPVYNEESIGDSSRLLGHEAALVMNNAVKEHSTKLNNVRPSAHIKSPPIVDTHSPALLVSDGNNVKTLTVFALADFSGGKGLNKALNEFSESHEGYVIHRLFSLSCRLCDSDLRESLAQIKAIQDWVNDESFTISCLYTFDSHDFSEYYSLSKEFSECLYRSQKERILEKLRVLDKHGRARLMEYKARWWVLNDKTKTPAYPEGFFCTSIAPSKLAGSNLVDVANSIITLSNCDVNNSEFSRGLRLISQYIAPEPCAKQIDKLAAKLSKPKRLSFINLSSMTAYAYALLYAGAHRFFRHNCDESEAGEWLSKLYTHREADLSILSNKRFIARQALDVDYARHLLKNPLPKFETKELKRSKVRYVSNSSPVQSSSSTELQALLDTQAANNNLVDLWSAKNKSFTVLDWFESCTGQKAKDTPIEVVDMVFTCITNLILCRPSYIHDGPSQRFAIQLIPLLNAAASYYGYELNFYCSSNTASSIQPKLSGITLKQGKPALQKNSDVCCFILHRPHDVDNVSLDLDSDTAVIRYLPAVARGYTEQRRELVRKGQMLLFAKEEPHVLVKELSPTKNPDILKQTFDHYTGVFDAIRQLGSLAYKISDRLRKELLKDRLDSCASSEAFSWWLSHQSTFLYGSPSLELQTKRKEHLTRLKQTPSLTYGDEAALNAIQKEQWLYLPDIKSCNSDAWVAELSEQLTASLQSPQVVTTSLDFIKNGLQPILLYSDSQDELLHHTLVAKTKACTPFSFLYELRSELSQLKELLQKNPSNKLAVSKIKLVTSALDSAKKEREREISSLFEGKQSFAKPLIEDAVHCFLDEVNQFYLQDVTGERSLLKAPVLFELSSLPEYKSFIQLSNTIKQYLEDDFLPKLPLSCLDTIAYQISIHGYNVSMPHERDYCLLPSDSGLGDMWVLANTNPASFESTDMRITTHYGLAKLGNIDDVKHSLRQSRLLLCSLPNSTQDVATIKSSISRVQALLSSISLVDVWMPTTLNEADEARKETLRSFLGGAMIDDINYLSVGSRRAASQLLKTSPGWLAMSHIHKDSDAIYILSLISQSSKGVQSTRIKELNSKIDMQNSALRSANKLTPATLPQSVFTRRTPAYRLNDVSIEDSLIGSLNNKGIATTSSEIINGSSDSIHDIYYKDSYLPVDLQEILKLAARQVMLFKRDLNEMIESHPQKDSLISMLSDHESNAEADYFLSLSDSERQAYIYKYLIQDMGYRGIKQKLRADLSSGNKSADFNAKKAVVSHKLSLAGDDLASIEALCLYIHKNTGDSSYIDQLQAQQLAKQMVESYIDSVCNMAKEGSTELELPVVCCRPKPNLNTSEMAKNLPALNKMFARGFCDLEADSTTYLGKNEWLITCGIKLPHYDQIIDLNNLVSYVVTAGVDLGKNDMGFVANARHLYSTYVDKRSLLVAKTHDVLQGRLSLEFSSVEEGFSVQKTAGFKAESFSSSNPISWESLEEDLESYKAVGGVGYEQLLVGGSEYAQYCKNYPDLYEVVQFNDVSGRLYKAFKMREHAKSRYLNFSKLFSGIKPIRKDLLASYLKYCIKAKIDSISVYGFSSKIDGDVAIHVEKGVVQFYCTNLILQDKLQCFAENNSVSHKPTRNGISVNPKDVASVVAELGLSGFYAHQLEFDLLKPLVAAYAERLSNKVIDISIVDSASKGSLIKKDG